MNVVCTRCGATNRVPEGRSLAEGKCGKCGAALFDGRPADVSGAVLEKQIARSDLPVLVDVWAPWCGPCRVMGPQFEAATRAGEPTMRFIKLNSDENQELAGRLGIKSIPTMILFARGREVRRASGAMPSSEILSWASDLGQ